MRKRKSKPKKVEFAKRQALSWNMNFMVSQKEQNGILIDDASEDPTTSVLKRKYHFKAFEYSNFHVLD